MANNLNQCNFIGNLGADPEIRFTKSNEAVATISLAVGESRKDAQGQKKEHTEWVRAVAFKRLAEVFRDYTHKGSKVFISARCKTRKWQDQAGQDRYTTEFIVNQLEMLDSRQDGQQPQQQQPQQQQPPQQYQQAPQQAPADIDSDIPF